MREMWNQGSRGLIKKVRAGMVAPRSPLVTWELGNRREGRQEGVLRRSE